MHVARGSKEPSSCIQILFFECHICKCTSVSQQQIHMLRSACLKSLPTQPISSTEDGLLYIHQGPDCYTATLCMCCFIALIGHTCPYFCTLWLCVLLSVSDISLTAQLGCCSSVCEQSLALCTFHREVITEQVMLTTPEECRVCTRSLCSHPLPPIPHPNTPPCATLPLTTH